MSSWLDFLYPIGWASMGAAIGLAAYVLFSTRFVRTLVAKRRELSAALITAPENERMESPVYTKLKALRTQGIDDPDVELFLAIFENNIDLLKAALSRGANPNITDTEVLSRHKDKLSPT